MFGYGGHDVQVNWPIADELEDGIGEFADFSTAQQCIRKLCAAAVEVDGEPGVTSGFHVHVGSAGTTLSTCYEMLWQFARWEDTLSALAAGRWAYVREMNRSVRGLLCDYIRHPDDYGDNVKQYAWEYHLANDRHSNLNISTAHGTFEFRIWNSTRVAWRMEMFVEMSVALTDETVLADLASVDPSTVDEYTAIDLLREAVLGAGYDNLAAHIARQSEYLRTRASTAPATLACL